MKRRNLFLADELWEKVQRAALEEAVKKGEPAPVSASEWIREAVRQRLEKEGG
jgi:hypothetical protein